jgi:N-acetylglucosaminyldiphosphoundecaprenol N-acetyl-beta-D-mannosaminyltransferase
VNSVPRFSFGTVQMSCLDMESALDALYGFVAQGQGGYIACTCTHGIVDSEHDERLRSILNGSLLTLPDGMPTVWVGRAKGMPVRRVTAPDFLEAALADPRARRVRHYFFGGSPKTLERIVARATHILGRPAIAGSYSPPIRPAGVPEDPQTLTAIAAAKPDIIWVGLGLPKQELWMANHTAQFPRAVMVGVGAAFDWFAGTQARAPKWVQSLGLEWAHRVLSEPTRLWPRYRVVVPKALGIMLREITSGKVFARRVTPA